MQGATRSPLLFNCKNKILSTVVEYMVVDYVDSIVSGNKYFVIQDMEGQKKQVTKQGLSEMIIHLDWWGVHDQLHCFPLLLYKCCICNAKIYLSCRESFCLSALSPIFPKNAFQWTGLIKAYLCTLLPSIGYKIHKDFSLEP